MTAIAAPARSGAAGRVSSSGARASGARTDTGGAARLSALALRLATGDAGAAPLVSDWPALFAVARRERLAAVAWSRCGAEIRRHCVDELVARWRALFADATRTSEPLLDACAAATDALAARHITLVVLKGAPLAERLYGDPGVRCSDDVDCYVAPEQRVAAGRALLDAGWRRVLGAAPGDETFALSGARGDLRLEVHSALVSERLSHLPAGEPQWTRRPVSGRALAVHTGPLVPAYLASHLATHFAPPLLWWLDLRNYWRSLSEADRAEARLAAASAGLARYLVWGLRGAESVERALAGDARALTRIGVHADGRRDSHQLWRHLALAPDMGARMAALRAWVRPPWAAERDGGALLGTIRRVRRHWRSALSTSASPAPVDRLPASRAGRGHLSVGELVEVTREVVGVGGEVSLTLTGDSMAPTMRPGDRLLLAAPRRRPRVGEVVLAMTGANRPVVHRIVGLVRTSGGDLLETRGDNCATSDPPVHRDAVLAHVVASERAGVWTAHSLTLRFGPRAALRGALLAVRARVAYRWRRFARSAGASRRVSDG